MKKRYTKRQIQESIAYWQKQLRAKNYTQLDESISPGSKMYQIVWKFSNAEDNPEFKLYTSKELAKKYAEEKMSDDDDGVGYHIREYTVVK